MGFWITIHNETKRVSHFTVKKICIFVFHIDKYNRLVKLSFFAVWWHRYILWTDFGGEFDFFGNPSSILQRK